MSEVDRAIAESALMTLIDRLGLAFHPEMPIHGYVESERGPSDLGILDATRRRAGSPVFDDEEVAHYQACLDLAWQTFGDEIYTEIAKHEPWKTYLADEEST